MKAIKTSVVEQTQKTSQLRTKVIVKPKKIEKKKAIIGKTKKDVP